jgi:hypothetical protein
MSIWTKIIFNYLTFLAVEILPPTFSRNLREILFSIEKNKGPTLPLLPLYFQSVSVLTGSLGRHLNMQAPFILLPGQCAWRP